MTLLSLQLKFFFPSSQQSLVGRTYQAIFLKYYIVMTYYVSKIDF